MRRSRYRFVIRAVQPDSLKAAHLLLAAADAPAGVRIYSKAGPLWRGRHSGGVKLAATRKRSEMKWPVISHLRYGTISGDHFALHCPCHCAQLPQTLCEREGASEKTTRILACGLLKRRPGFGFITLTTVQPDRRARSTNEAQTRRQ